MGVSSRYPTGQVPSVADGWVLERLTPHSRLHAANGICPGPDGRLYIAQCVGSQISALDPDSGAVETIAPMGGAIVAPDDLAFDRAGNLFVTECMDARVSVIERGGRTRVLRDDLPGANGITFFQDRLFVDECRLGGRLLELDLAGGTPRVLLEGLDLPNALAPGPDGMLYFPLVGASEIWRVHPDGGPAERVVGGLGTPVAVKFDGRGRIVSPQSHTGEVLRIDAVTGRCEVIARLAPGLDNLAFCGERLFVSHHTTGQITEIGQDGTVREVVAPGFMFPLDIARDAAGGIVISDNSTIYRLAADGALIKVTRIFEPSFPGSIRGLAIADGRLLVTTADGRLVEVHPDEERYESLLDGLDQPAGVALGANGAVWVTEKAGGRVLCLTGAGLVVVARGLDNPMGVAISPDGGCYVTEKGRVLFVEMGGGTETVADGMIEPHGAALHEGTLYVVDAGARAVLAVDLATGERSVLAADLPVGAPPGVTAKPLLGMPPLSGPFGPFAGITVASNGDLTFSADGEGSLMRLRRRYGARAV